jgi:probable F420-dependent oxidoreductase
MPVAPLGEALMDIGLNMPTHGLLHRQGRDIFIEKVAPEELRLAHIAERAEQLGYHSLWFPDHVLMPRVIASAHTVNPESGKSAYDDQPNMLDAAVTMAAIAARTTTIRLAPSVLISPYRHPLSDARQFASIDVLSGGRLLMAVGPGWCKEEFDALELHFAMRSAMTEECLQIYKLAWTQPWLSFNGQFYNFPDVSIDPKPAQRPRPRIVYGGVTAAGARRALRHCDGFYPIVTEADAGRRQFTELRDLIRREAAAMGRDLESFQMLTLVMCLLNKNGDAPLSTRPRPFMTGNAEQVAADLEMLARLDYSHCTLHLDVRSRTIAEFVDMMEEFGELVLPLVGNFEAVAL